MPYRDIKFRAWDKQHKEMTMVNTLSFNLSTMNRNEEYRLNYIIEFKLGSLVRQDGENMILMQYIGLKDGHGKEIYEGDIVKADSSYHIWGGAKLKVFYGEVKFEPERGYYCVFKDTNRTDIDKNHIEVIGNIYQNPELSCSNKG